jgi:hypothetical protein
MFFIYMLQITAAAREMSMPQQHYPALSSKQALRAETANENRSGAVLCVRLLSLINE